MIDQKINADWKKTFEFWEREKQHESAIIEDWIKDYNEFLTHVEREIDFLQTNAMEEKQILATAALIHIRDYIKNEIEQLKKDKENPPE